MVIERFNKTGSTNQIIEINDIFINEEFVNCLKKNELVTFDDIFSFKEGDVFRENKVRCVKKITILDSNGIKQIFHLKTHTLSFKEKIKYFFNLVVEDGKNEWDKMILLNSLGILTMNPVAFGEKKMFFLPYQSFTITQDLQEFVRLEDYIEKNFTGLIDLETKQKKNKIIEMLALIARNFHAFGFNHKDFYLGHFFIKANPLQINMIDLQRVSRKKVISQRSRVKDLSQLYFSTTQINGVTKKDCVKFFKEYLSIKKLRKQDKLLINKIIIKNSKITKHTKKILGFVKS